MVISILILSLLAVPAIVVAARWFDSHDWRKTLIAYELRIPGTTTTADVARWLARLQVMTESPRWYLLPNTPVALELVAKRGSIRHMLLVPERLQQSVLASLHAALPSVRVTEAPQYLDRRPVLAFAAEATLTTNLRPLDTTRAAETSQHILAALQPLATGEEVYVQWILSGVTRHPVKRATRSSEAPWWTDEQFLLDAEDVRDERLKQKTALMAASLRVGITAPGRPAALSVFRRVWPAFAGMDSQGVRLLKRWIVSPGGTARRLSQLQCPAIQWPLVVNVDEASGLVGFSANGLHLPGLEAGVSRVLPAPSTMASRGLVLGESNYPGASRPLALTRYDRLRHLWTLGPTGSGKSTLLLNLITQDIAAGDGVIVIDARGDLVYDVLDRIPDNRREDVVVLDAANTEHVVGFNPLSLGINRRGRELAAEHILSVLHSVYQASWGNRTADVLRAGLLTLVNAHGVDGSRLTLVELPELLVNDEFRMFVLRQPVEPTLRTFWVWYSNLSVPERTAIISPVLNKLRGFTLSSPIRRTLGQSEGIDLSEAFIKKKIILVPLKKGLLGAETTTLLGSLIMAGVWSATLARADIPPERRRPTWLYADEFQEIMRLPLDFADMLAMSRGLGLGITLAHQYLGQLSPDLKAAVLGTTRSQVVFQVEHDDAKTLAPRFAPLNADDLQGLGTHEVAIRPSVGGHTLAPVTAVTYPPPPTLNSARDVAARSQAKYAKDAGSIDAALAARINTEPSPRTNRRKKGGER